MDDSDCNRDLLEDVLAILDGDLPPLFAVEAADHASHNAQRDVESGDYPQRLLVHGEAPPTAVLGREMTTPVNVRRVEPTDLRVASRSCSSTSNRARNDRKRDISDLQRQISELTVRLEALRGARHEYCTSNQAPLPTGSAMELLPQLWRTVCRHQLSQRVRSEQENRRLLRAVAEQKQLINSLQTLAKKPERILHSVSLDLGSKRVYSLPRDSETDAAIWSRLIAEVEAACLEADAVMQLNGLQRASQTCSGTHVRDGDFGQFVDIVSSTVLPFGVEATARAVWELYSGPKKHRGPLYYKTARKCEPSESTIMEKFAIELNSQGTRADFRVWQILRRYVRTDGVLVVWMGFLEPVEFANQSFSSCAFREKGYVMCKQPEDSVPATSTAPMTHLLRCHRIVPMTKQQSRARLHAKEQREIRAVMDFVISLDSITAHFECFEDLLMHQYTV